MDDSRMVELHLSFSRKWRLTSCRYFRNSYEEIAMTVAPETRDRDFNADAIVNAYSEVFALLPAKLNPESEWLKCFSAWEELKRWIDGTIARRRFQENQDTRDADAREAVRMVREEIEPLLEPNEARLRQAFLEAVCRPALEKALGEQLFARFSIAQAAYDPANTPLRVKESEIAAEYMRLLGGAELDAAGENMTLMGAVARLADPDATTRRIVWNAVVGWLEGHTEEFHSIYDRLIAVRHQMALNLGEKDYTPVAYRRMVRTDYGPAEVARFREEIREHVLPVMLRLRKWQANALGDTIVAPWDTEFYPGLSLKAGVAPVSQQLERMQALFDRLDPRMAAHFRTMTERGLIDLPTRAGKAAGAFCTVFEDSAEVAIFCNSTGNAADIIMLTHEMGHAIQVWESLALPAADLRWPGMDAAEVLSMGLELLSLREIGAFFDEEDALRYRRLIIVTMLNRLPYAAVVDAFQHWVYAHPTHSHVQREAKWDELWQAFLPGVDESVHGQPHRTRWMRQLHLFMYPFYYIDYALAECGALQLWELSERDHPAAMETYLKLCAAGGTLPLVAFFESAGLRSPFTPGLLGPLMEKLATELGI
jgi:M3 family oligoendopeptidase